MTKLIPLADDLWCAESELRTPLGVVFPIRMTVVRHGDELTLLSPIAVDDDLGRALETLGRVRNIVAPNLFHHVHLEAAAQRFPQASLWAPPGLAKKRPDLTFDATLEGGSTPFGLEVLALEGAPALHEHVFFHAPSGTLVVTDLVFNMSDAANWISRFVFRYVARAYQRVAQSRLFRLFVKDRAAAASSLGRMLELDFDRLVMAHGDIVATGGRAALAEGTRWMQSGGTTTPVLTAAV
ncbi:MAG: DUF4336 domain-containing protein [Myxococcota bacterium]